MYDDTFAASTLYANEKQNLTEFVVICVLYTIQENIYIWQLEDQHWLSYA